LIDSVPRAEALGYFQSPLAGLAAEWESHKQIPNSRKVFRRRRTHRTLFPLETPMQNAPGSIEHRRIPRILVNFQAVLIWKGKRIHCQARNLSEAGVLLATSHKELVGENIQIQLLLQPPSPSLLLTGSVIYVVPSGIGVRFKEVSPEQRPVLQTYLQAHGMGLLKR
jgi:PilZ domain-containing protein